MKLFFVILLLISTTGCFTTKVIDSRVDADEEFIDYKHKDNLSGLIQTDEPVYIDCPKGIAEISYGRTFGDIFFSGITFGIIHQQTVRVRCAL